MPVWLRNKKILMSIFQCKVDFSYFGFNCCKRLDIHNPLCRVVLNIQPKYTQNNKTTENDPLLHFFHFTKKQKRIILFGRTVAQFVRLGKCLEFLLRYYSI